MTSKTPAGKAPYQSEDATESTGPMFDLANQVLGVDQGDETGDTDPSERMEIKYVNRGGDGTTVKLGGVDFAGACTGISIRLDLGQRPVVVLDIAVLEMDLDTMTNKPLVFLHTKAKELLIKLGWTPPAGEWGSTPE
jgi:hypothetical protein